MSEMKNTRYVQRLTKPRSFGGLGFKDNPFSFGGGLKNGGLSDEAMNLIRDIFGFDYMGSAEYEFGAVPKALQKIAGADLACSTITIPIKEVERYWKDKGTDTPEGDATVYILGPKDDLPEIEDRVHTWGRQEPKYPDNFKESSHLSLALRPYEEWHADFCGWLELDNGFFFFTDKEMFEKTCALFGVEVAVA